MRKFWSTKDRLYSEERKRGRTLGSMNKEKGQLKNTVNEKRYAEKSRKWTAVPALLPRGERKLKPKLQGEPGSLGDKRLTAVATG
jgi:hypothetical protein